MGKAIFNAETMGNPSPSVEEIKPINLQKETEEEQMVNKGIDAINNMNAGGDGQSGKEASEEELKMMTITDEETELASQMIFKGYAEKEFSISVLPDVKFKICSTSSEDVDTVNGIMYEEINNNRDENGDVKISEREVISLKNSVNLAVSYIGVDGTDVSVDPITKMNSIKSGILKLSELTSSGDLDSAKDLKESLYTAIKSRAALIRKLPTPVIDMISKEKYKFDSRMFEIMDYDGIIPK